MTDAWWKRIETPAILAFQQSGNGGGHSQGLPWENRWSSMGLLGDLCLDTPKWICEDLEWLVDKAVSTNLIKKLRKLVLPENGPKTKKNMIYHSFILKLLTSRYVPCLDFLGYSLFYDCRSRPAGTPQLRLASDLGSQRSQRLSAGVVLEDVNHIFFRLGCGISHSSSWAAL